MVVRRMPVGIYNNATSLNLLHVTDQRLRRYICACRHLRLNAATPSWNDVSVNVAGGQDGHGIQNVFGSSPNMTNMTVNVSGGASSNYGIENADSSAILNNVIAKASGGTSTDNYGVYKTLAPRPQWTG